MPKEHVEIKVNEAENHVTITCHTRYSSRVVWTLTANTNTDLMVKGQWINSTGPTEDGIGLRPVDSESVVLFI